MNSNHERPTDAQIEAITRDVIAGNAASNSYLQLLVISIQSLLGSEKGKRIALDAIASTHDSFYAVVLRTIGPDVSPILRNRRANFARSAASTLRAYVRAGGRMQAIDPLSVSKQGLREASGPVIVGTPREQSFTRAADRVTRIAARLAKDNPAQARARLRTAISALQTQLHKLDAVKAAPAPRAAVGRRVGKRAGHRSVTHGMVRTRSPVTVHRARAH